MIWLDLVIFCAPGAETTIALFDKGGVDRVTDGRLRAAGSISGIVERDVNSSVAYSARGTRATRRSKHYTHRNDKMLMAT